jgi:YVTN family beta-propeller protein
MVAYPSRPALYVAVTNRDLVAVINTSTDAVTQQVSVARPQGVGVAPVSLAESPDGQTLYSADESIIKLITYRFGLGSFTTRDDPTLSAVVGNVGEALDFAPPKYDLPSLPDPEQVVSRPCTLGGGDVVQDNPDARERPRSVKRRFRHLQGGGAREGT